MGANLFKTSSSFRETILSLQRTSTAHGFPSFSHFISDPGTVMENATTAQIQLALVSLEMALVDLWKSWGVAPDWVIGHSIGEYAALYAARVLSAADVMYLVGRRARLIQNSCTEGTNGMLSISGTPDEIECIVKGQYPDLKSLNYEVACQNSPGMVVLSGERGGLARVESMSKEIGLKCRILDVPYAMHSRQMESILPGLRDIAQGLHFEAPDANVKIISTLSGAEHVVFDSEYIVRHTREPVNFQQAVSHCVKQGLIAESALWLELGPNPVCLGLARANTNSITPDRLLTSLKKGEDDWKCVSKTIATCYAAGKTIGWRAYHRDFAKNLTLLTLPKYAFETRDFWMPYTEAATVVTRVRENGTEKPISTCLHHLIGQQDDVVEQRAIFTCMLSEPSLLRIIQGHRLSGITICPAGVFSEMALTAARYMLGGGSWAAPFPPLSVLDTQIDHPIMPEPNISQAIKVAVSRFDGSNEFSVSISDQAKPDVISSKCLVRIRDEHTFQDERRRLLDVIQPRIVKLQKAAIAGAANRFQGKLFYRLFANLMGYDERYEGVKEAIVSSDFTEALASVQLPVETDDMYTLSPYWIDALTHLAGFLFNGNPMSTTDDVYIGTHMERMEIVAKDFSPDITYQSYASVEHDVPSGTYRGNVYILDGDFVVGFLEGARFRKMPRTTLHRILGKPAPPKQVGEQSSRPITNGTTIKANGTNGVNGTNGTDVNGMNGVNGTNGVNGHTTAASAQSADTVSNGHSKSLYSILIDLLVEETGMEADELTASTYFAEIGVDSLMSISILAMLKTETGIELNASFLMDYPTLEDAGRELRKLENKQNAIQNPSLPIADGNAPTESLPECNLVLMQGNAVASPSHTPLFLLADGAGSAAAYIHLPKLGSDLSVYAVESPWVNDPENFTCSFDRAAGLYLSAIRAKQPCGPYMIGGWSGGGVFAYEVARLLLEAGEVVLGLIIIDITGPRAEDISKITPPSIEVIDKIGMLSGIERNFDDTAPQSVRLKQHMLSTVACFAGVKPIPMVSGRQPGCTSVIWAKKDILPKSAQASLPSGLDAWFYPSSHADIKPYGWDALVGGNLDIFQIEGDHFSIMTVPEAS
jgi:iterative type I PKS product template protein